MSKVKVDELVDRIAFEISVEKNIGVQHVEHVDVIQKLASRLLIELDKEEPEETSDFEKLINDQIQVLIDKRSVIKAEIISINNIVDSLNHSIVIYKKVNKFN